MTTSPSTTPFFSDPIIQTYASLAPQAPASPLNQLPQYSVTDPGNYNDLHKPTPTTQPPPTTLPPVQTQPSPFKVAIPLPSLSRGPAPVDCPICHDRALTRCEYEAGGFTHLLGIVMCLFMAAGCVPYMMRSCKDCRHFCGNCGYVCWEFDLVIGADVWNFRFVDPFWRFGIEVGVGRR